MLIQVLFVISALLKTHCDPAVVPGQQDPIEDSSLLCECLPQPTSSNVNVNQKCQS